MTDNTSYTYTPPLAPPEFEHAMRQAAYQLKRANRFDALIVNTDGERAIAPRCPSDVAEGKIPNGGFNGS